MLNGTALNQVASSVIVAQPGAAALRRVETQFYNRDNPGTIENFPDITAPIGPGDPADLRLPDAVRQLAKQFQFSNDPEKYNAGYKAGAAGWAALLAASWDAAVAQGRKMQAQHGGCCDQVMVVFTCFGEDANADAPAYCGRAVLMSIGGDLPMTFGEATNYMEPDSTLPPLPPEWVHPARKPWYDF
jgi:hypothetical protein